jgi:hypothetical protein
LALAVVLTAVLSMGADFRTTNFHVHAADPQVAQLMGQWAEHYRKEKAVLWLGREMPNWSQPCPLYVEVNTRGPSGATSFNFGQGQVLGMKMEIEGPLERLVRSVLPHEITHTVFAFHFRQPVPRWADEGGSVLSEDDIERERHDQLVRSIINRGQKIPIRTLLGLKEYPAQVMCLYAQGYSISDFLVKRSNRQQFLNFVGRGMQAGWDRAAQEYYGHRSVEELEGAWLQFLRDGRKTPGGAVVASATKGQIRSHLTVPPHQPLEVQPVARAAMPSQEQMGQNFGKSPIAPNWQPSVKLQAPEVVEPGIVVPARQGNVIGVAPGRSSGVVPAGSRSAVQLMAPETETPPTSAPPGSGVPKIGYPR